MLLSQTMKDKQSSLLAQLDTLDEECGTLRAGLSEVSSNREKLATNLKLVQAQYEQVQEHLSKEQVRLRHYSLVQVLTFFSLQSKLAEANQVQYKLDAQLSTLQAELTDTKEQVEKEKKNCR